MKLAPATIAFAALCAATPALGANLRVEMEIPRTTDTEYHFPYVAIWIERPDREAVMNLAVWYDRDAEGMRYLPDLRSWWRAIGRDTRLPLDGVTGATRAPGLNGVALLGSQFPLRDLQRGEYNIVIEAVRERGGRELIRIPLDWTNTGRERTLTARGETEIGRIMVTIYP
jgi:hypothetical protein